MPPVTLLIEDARTAGEVRDQVQAAATSAGLTFTSCVRVDQALDQLRSASGDNPTVLVVLAPRHEGTVALARQVHRAAPMALLVFLVDAPSPRFLSQVQSPVAMIGSQWHIVDVATVPLRPALQEITHLAVQRHQLRTTLDRINQRLAVSPATDGADSGSIRASDQLLAHILQNARDAIIATNAAGKILLWNGAAEGLLGLQAADAIGRSLAEAGDGEWREAVPRMLASIRVSPDHHARQDIAVLRQDGEIVDIELVLSLVRADASTLLGSVAIARDIGERKRLEDERTAIERQMQQAQKLESLGVLAGGIAHDFNNLLTGVLGNADLALLDLSAGAPAREPLEEIRNAALRAADLCKQMLAYSGRGRFLVQPIDLNEVLADMAQLLKLSISKTAVVKTDLAEGLPAVEADISQLRQVIMNLITNASEAIGNNPGVISLRTYTVQCDAAFLSEMVLHEELKEGLYVALEVSDTGAGMTPDTLARIFDPFFTTKFSGRGLGLAAVLGIMRGHKGALKVESTKGHGTTFRIFFPRTTKPATVLSDEVVETAPVAAGEGTILIVDDEDTVRSVAAKTLQGAGYTVLTAADGLEGITTFHQVAHELALVLIDLTMPQLGGDVVFAEMQVVNPDVPIILMSGYSQQELSNRFAGRGLAGFLQKPLRPRALLTLVSSTLSER